MSSEPSLGQKPSEDRLMRLLEKLSINKYKPNQEDINRILGTGNEIKQQEQSWLSSGQGAK